LSCEVLDARLAVAGHLDVISDPVASKLVHTYLTSLEYELFLPWGSAKSSELPLIHTGSSVCLATQRALHRLHSHVVYLETSVRCAQVHQVLDSTENLAVESEAVGGGAKMQPRWPQLQLKLWFALGCTSSVSSRLIGLLRRRL
jgi:hypothetical protein